jgi:hypothetical protein
VENSCEECDAILRAHRIAYLDFWEKASPKTRDACRALGKLMEGSEADIQCVEENLPRFRSMSAEQLNTATLNAGLRYLRGEDPIKDAMLKK